MAPLCSMSFSRIKTTLGQVDVTFFLLLHKPLHSYTSICLGTVVDVDYRKMMKIERACADEFATHR